MALQNFINHFIQNLIGIYIFIYLLLSTFFVSSIPDEKKHVIAYNVGTGLASNSLGSPLRSTIYISKNEGVTDNSKLNAATIPAMC